MPHVLTPALFFLNYFINRHCFLHVLDPTPNILYETSSDTHFYSLADEEFRVLVLVDLLKVKAIFEHRVTRLSKYSFEGIIGEI